MRVHYKPEDFWWLNIGNFVRLFAEVLIIIWMVSQLQSIWDWANGQDISYFWAIVLFVIMLISGDILQIAENWSVIKNLNDDR